MKIKIILSLLLVFVLASFVSAQTYSIGEEITLLEGSKAYVNSSTWVGDERVVYSFEIDPFLIDEVGFIINGDQDNPVMLSKGEKHTLSQSPILYLELKDISMVNNDGSVKFIVKQLECEDTDNGEDIYIFGERTNLNLNYADFGKKEGDYCILNPAMQGENAISDRAKEVNTCKGVGCYLIEHHCVDDLSNSFQSYACPQGYFCSSGACKSLNVSCSDTDNGNKPYVYGRVDDIREDPSSMADFCYNDKQLFEHVCEKEGYSVILFDCQYGCKDGICLGEVIDVEPTEETGPIQIPEPAEIPETQTIYFCNGCELDDKCYPLGYRKSGQYCSDNSTFISQLVEEVNCDNNFECSSNLCIDGSCVSSGLWQKILSWFKNLFG